jgi:hypothetical protein
MEAFEKVVEHLTPEIVRELDTPELFDGVMIE